MSEYLNETFNEREISNDFRNKNIIFLKIFYRDSLSGYAKLILNKKPPRITKTKLIELERLYILKSMTGKKLSATLLIRCIEVAKKIILKQSGFLSGKKIFKQ